MIIRPKEIKTVRYWFHLLLIAVIILFLLEFLPLFWQSLKGQIQFNQILNLLLNGEMFTIKNILISVPLLGVADITSHSILRID